MSRADVTARADDDAGLRIARAWRELRRGAKAAVLRRHLVGVDGPPLDPAQLDALEIIATAPEGCRMSELAEALRVDPSSATRAVDRLQRLGLAERVPGTPDRRVVVARPTPEGERTVARVVTLRNVGMERLLADFDDGERLRFAEMLERFIAAVDELVAELQRAEAAAAERAARRRPPA